MPIKDGANKMEIHRMRKMVASGVEPEEISRQLGIQQKAVENLIESFKMREDTPKPKKEEVPKTQNTGGATKGAPPTSKE